MKIPLILFGLALGLISMQSLADTYVRMTDGEEDPNEAVLTVTKGASGSMHVEGFSSWVPIGGSSGMTRIGSVSGELVVQGEYGYYKNSVCQLTLKFENEFIIVANDNHRCGGLNVTFDGRYQKTNRLNNE